MNILSVALIVLIGGACLVCTFSIPFAKENRRGWRRWTSIIATCLLVVGGAGFFGASLSATGGLNWLPQSFEWPVGYAHGIISTESGLHVVPHTPSGRVQVYDDKWSFLRGWPVDASGGDFKLHIPEDGMIHVVTARGRRLLVYDVDGKLQSTKSYEPKSYASFPNQGSSALVPTAPWLWPFTHPLIAWVMAASGLATLIALQKLDRRKAADQR